MDPSCCTWTNEIVVNYPTDFLPCCRWGEEGRFLIFSGQNYVNTEAASWWRELHGNPPGCWATNWPTWPPLEPSLMFHWPGAKGLLPLQGQPAFPTTSQDATHPATLTQAWKTLPQLCPERPTWPTGAHPAPGSLIKINSPCHYWSTHAKLSLNITFWVSELAYFILFVYLGPQMRREEFLHVSLALRDWSETRAVVGVALRSGGVWKFCTVATQVKVTRLLPRLTWCPQSVPIPWGSPAPWEGQKLGKVLAWGKRTAQWCQGQNLQQGYQSWGRSPMGCERPCHSRPGEAGSPPGAPSDRQPGGEDPALDPGGFHETWTEAQTWVCSK